ncbi:alcohol acetyltransferase [Xylariales sp. PMI_506]|nr:alcohol acetyltransferase [Xylariales sp. PMI_506]
MSCFAPRDDEDVLRPIGCMEAYQLGLATTNLYQSVLQGCRYSFPDSLATVEPSSECSIQETLARAIARTVLDYPMMQVALLEKSESKAYWMQRDSLSFADHLIWQTVDDDKSDLQSSFQTTATTYIDRKWGPMTEPTVPWRVVIIQPKSRANWVDVFFSWHHVIGDGTSGRMFHETLLRHLREDDGRAKSLPALNANVLRLQPMRNLTPTQEKLVKFSLSPGFIAKEITKLVHHKSAYTVNWIPIQTDTVKSAWSRFSIDGPSAKVILEACKKHSTSLTALLEALLLLAFATNVSADKASAFQSATPISLRRYIEKDTLERYKIDADNLFGNFVSEMFNKWDAPVVAKLRTQHASSAGSASRPEISRETEDTIWQIAGQVRRHITERLAKGTRDELAGMQKFIPNWPSYFRSQIKQPREVTWIISNIGSFDLSEKVTGTEQEKTARGSGWTIEDVAWLGSAYAHPSATLLRVTGIKGGHLTVTFNWQQDTMPDALCQNISHDLESWLNTLGTRGQFTLE